MLCVLRCLLLTCDIRRDSSLAASVEGVARWLLSYRAGDGQLASVRLEVYNKDK